MYAPRHKISSKIPFPNAVIKSIIKINTFGALYSTTEKNLPINAISTGNKTKGIIFKALADIHVKALSQSSEELNLSLVIEREDLMDAVKMIHSHICEE